MFNILSIGKIVYISLIVFQIAFVLIKNNKFIFLLFVCYLLLFFSRIFYLDNTSTWVILISIHNLFLINVFYYYKRRKIPLLWNLTLGFLILILFIIELLGFSFKLNSIILSVLLAAGSSIMPLKMIFDFYNKSGKRIFIFFFIILLIFTLSGIFDLIFLFIRDINLYVNFWASFLILSGCFCLLRDQTLNQLFAIEHKSEDDIFERLAEAEDKLIMNERLMISSYRIAGILHEFKNIISNIRLNTEYGLSKSNNLEKDKSLNLILNNTDEGMASVIQNLESIGLLGEKNKELINLDNIIKKIIKTMHSNYRNIYFKYERCSNITLKIHRMDLEQVIFNIMRNAVSTIIKKKKEDGSVVINTYIKGNLIIIDIKDNAGGIPDELQGVLFDPPSSYSLKKGLGLYLSKKLAVRNNGTLDYYPIENGSCFRIIFIGNKEV